MKKESTSPSSCWCRSWYVGCAYIRTPRYFTHFLGPVEVKEDTEVNFTGIVGDGCTRIRIVTAGMVPVASSRVLGMDRYNP